MIEGLAISRRKTRQIHIGQLPVGGDAPVSVQTMTKTDTHDVGKTVGQINEASTLGCDIVRLAVVDESAARTLSEIRGEVTVPLVADIHFDHKLALLAIEAGVDGLRINPGNIGGVENVRELINAAKERKIAVRVGVNSGSLEKELLEKHGSATPEALVESALGHVKMIEDLGHDQIKISAKTTSVQDTLATYRLLSGKTDYPLHLGVTEAGTMVAGTARSCVAIGILLSEGIGDTIRVSLTDSSANEVLVGLELLRALGLREPGASVISCPTCGRVQVDVVRVAREVEHELARYYAESPDVAKPVVAVMGCVVNGPGEAREADIAVAGGKGKFALYVGGDQIATIPEADVVPAIIEQVRAFKI